MSRTGRVIVRLTSLLFLLGTACGDDDSAPGILAPGSNGTIEGRILVVHGPVLLGRVTAASVGTPRGQEISATAWADSAGGYTLAVPFGRYQLTGNLSSVGNFAYRAAGPVSSGAGDTLMLWPGQEVIRADFLLGGAEIVIATPAILEHKELFLGLRPRGRSYSIVANRTGRCEGNEARFLFPELCPESYLVDLRTPWQEEIHGYREPLGSTSGAPAGDTVLVRVSGGHSQTISLHLNEPAVFRGQVEGAWRELARITGSPSAVPALEAWGPDSTLSRVAVQEVSPDGGFSLAIFDQSPGPIRLAYRPGWRWGPGTQWIGGATFTEATSWEVAPGREVSISPLTDAGLVLRVAVPEPLSRFPLYLTLHDHHGRQLTGPQSGGDGNIFVASVLAERLVYLCVKLSYSSCTEPWIPSWYPGVDSMSQATPVSLRDGEVIELETTVIRGGVIEGEFQAVPGWEAQSSVYLVPAADSARTICSAWIATGDFSFRFHGLVDGPYLLQGQYYDHSRWRRWWYPGSAWAGHADTVWVRDHALVSGVAWTAP